MSNLQHQNQELRGSYALLSRNLALFLKRYVYTEQKKKLIETKKENLAIVKERVAQIKASMTLYKQIDTAVTSG